MSERWRRPFLRGERVFLRPAERDEVGLLATWMNDAEVMETLGGRAPQGDLAEERWFEQLQEEQGKSRWHFLICLRADERPVGIAGLHSVDQVNGKAELGVGICEPALWDQGYGTEASRIAVDFGFGELRLHRIYLHVFATNQRGVHVYKKLGFRLEGTGRRASYHHGSRHDVHVMGLLRDEWQAQTWTRTWERT